jgi:glycosyltransferase involved in cell wall biosynthesis
MRIAVIGTRGFPDVQGGIETYCEEICPRLVERGCSVIAYMRAAYVDPSRRSFRGVVLEPIAAPTNRYLETLVHTARAVRRAQCDGADIVYFQGIGPSVFAPYAHRLGMKVVMRHVGADYRRAKWSRPAQWFLRWCERVAVHDADAIVSISHVITRDVRRRRPRAEIFTIPNGAPRRGYGGGFATGARLGLERGRYFLTVGRLVREKRIEDAIDAFASARIDGWRLVIAGGAKARDRYTHSLIARAACAPGIIMTGLLAHAALDELYANASAFLLPSSHEGLSLALLEALGHGLPCLASDIPANHAAGLPAEWLVPVGDVDALSVAMHRVAHAPSKDTRALALRLAAAHDWEQTADDTVAVLEHVLNGSLMNARPLAAQ